MMTQKRMILVGAFCAFIIMCVALGFLFFGKAEVAPVIQSPESASYLINDEKVTLVQTGDTSDDIGSTESFKKYFGNEAQGDLNKDKVPDSAFVVTQTGGGSGTFFYVVASIKTEEGYVGTNAVFLGDRIAPQSTEIVNGEIIVNYADRRENESMVTEPSVGKTKYLKVTAGVLSEITR